jgi:hypothetical protein
MVISETVNSGFPDKGFSTNPYKSDAVVFIQWLLEFLHLAD